LSDFNRTVLDSIADPISIIDVNTFRIVDANRAFLKEIDLPVDKVLGRTCHEITHHRSSPCTGPDSPCPLMETMSQDDHASTDHVHWTHPGKRCYVDVITSPIRDEKGEIVQAVHIQRNITGRKQSEEDLRESREFHRVVVEGKSDAVYAKDPAGRYRLFNAAASRVTGKSAEEVLGLDDTFLFPADEARAVMDGDRIIVEAARTLTYEEHLTSVDGEQLVFLSTKGPLFDEQCNVTGIFGITRDITERKKEETECLEYERRFLHAQKMESLGVLAGGIAHDFNNLLTVILGNMDLALMILSSDSPVRSRIEQAMQAGRHAANLTKQMLDYTGKGLFVMKDADINDVVRENAELFRTSVARTVNLEIITAKHLPPIKADKGQIHQVIMNLVINASEAIESGRGAITLRTGMRDCDETYLNCSRLEEKPSPGRFVFAEVADMGCGMDEESRRWIFEPFFTTKFTGRGLGLAAVLGIIRKHKGAILVESEEGSGSVFRVLFPTSSDDIMIGIREIDETVYRENIPSTLNGTVLIVDDEDHVREKCVTFVQHLGFKAIGVAAGFEALDIFSDQGIDISLVILDLTMPNMDRVHTFHKLRQIRPDISFILTSGYSGQEVLKRFPGDRPAGFIQKPFLVHDL
jgi:two-component system cell cycle sensor histidine kinase/response regulator CckA